MVSSRPFQRWRIRALDNPAAKRTAQQTTEQRQRAQLQAMMAALE